MEIVDYHTELGHTSALIIDRGTKWMSIIPIESHAVRVRRVPLTEERYMTPATFNGKPYPITRAVRHYKKHAKSFGITKSAKRVLAGGK